MTTQTECSVPNLDCMYEDELRAFAVTQPSRKKAREMFPTRPPGYTVAARNVGSYAANKATAMGLRASGEIAQALLYEEVCDRIYQKLPWFARW